MTRPAVVPGLWCSDPYARIAVAAGAFLAGMGLGGGRSGLADDEGPRRYDASGA